MDTRLAALAAANGGHFTAADAHDCGYDARAISAAVRAGEWRRLRRGCFAPADVYDELDPTARHLVLVRAVVAKLRDRVVVTHQSGSCAHGHSQWGWDMSVVHVTRLDRGSPRREAGVFHHVGSITDDDLVEHDGLLVSQEDRVVMEACSQLSVEAGLVVADSALHMGRVSEQDLEVRALRCREWPGSRGARLAIWLSDGRAETAGETRSRYLFWRFAIPAPTLQYEVYDSSGLLVGRTDFAWEAYAHLGEFDGRLKYMRDAQPDEDLGAVVFREKQREDALRCENLGMSRLVWADLERGRRARTARRFQRGLEESRHRFLRNRVVLA